MVKVIWLCKNWYFFLWTEYMCKNNRSEVCSSVLKSSSHTRFLQFCFRKVFKIGSVHCTVWLQSNLIRDTSECFVLLLFKSVQTCEGTQKGVYLMGWGLQVISWDCCSVLEATPEHMWGWHSAGSSLCAPHPPSSSGFLPLSAAAFPVRKTSHSLCQGEPLCGYCSALGDKQDKGDMRHEKQKMFQSTHTMQLKHTIIWPEQITWVMIFLKKKWSNYWLNRTLFLLKVSLHM